MNTPLRDFLHGKLDREINGCFLKNTRGKKTYLETLIPLVNFFFLKAMQQIFVSSSKLLGTVWLSKCFTSKTSIMSQTPFIGLSDMSWSFTIRARVSRRSLHKKIWTQNNVHKPYIVSVFRMQSIYHIMQTQRPLLNPKQQKDENGKSIILL